MLLSYLVSTKKRKAGTQNSARPAGNENNANHPSLCEIGGSPFTDTSFPMKFVCEELSRYFHNYITPFQGKKQTGFFNFYGRRDNLCRLDGWVEQVTLEA
jgi:hypothetical protein